MLVILGWLSFILLEVMLMVESSKCMGLETGVSRLCAEAIL
jgi:hypothetical protein